MPKENKVDNSELEKRILLITEMLLAGLRRREIFEQEVVKRWDLAERQLDNYIYEAKKEFLKIGQKDVKKTYIKVKNRYEYLYKKLVNIKDYKGALIAVEKEAVLDGVISPSKIAQTNIEGTETIEQSDRALIKAIADGFNAKNKD